MDGGVTVKGVRVDGALDYNVLISAFQMRAVSYAQSYLNNVKVRFMQLLRCAVFFSL